LREIVLIHLSGAERPGLSACLTGVLAQAGAVLLDIEQTLVHGAQTLVAVVQVEAGQSAVLDAQVQAAARQQAVLANVTALSHAQYQRGWRARPSLGMS
jgi:phosphoserine phosphatase